MLIVCLIALSKRYSRLSALTSFRDIREILGPIKQMDLIVYPWLASSSWKHSGGSGRSLPSYVT